MPKHYLIGLACCAGLALAACQHKPVGTVGQIPPLADPCPSEGLAPLKAEPATPLVDPVERGVVYGAIAQAIGNDKAQAIIRFWETEVPTWGRLGWERVEKTKAWCDKR